MWRTQGLNEPFGFQMVVGGDDVAQPLLRAFVAPINVGVVLFHQILIGQFNRISAVGWADAKHFKRLAVRLQDLSICRTVGATGLALHAGITRENV